MQWTEEILGSHPLRSGSDMSDIVVIEEDKLLRGLLSEWLSAEGYSVRAAASGDATPQDRTDLVIVDVYMPRHGGAQKLRAVKAAPNGPISIAAANSSLPTRQFAAASARRSIAPLGVRP